MCIPTTSCNQAVVILCYLILYRGYRKVSKMKIAHNDEIDRKDRNLHFPKNAPRARRMPLKSLAITLLGNISVRKSLAQSSLTTKPHCCETDKNFLFIL